MMNPMSVTPYSSNRAAGNFEQRPSSENTNLPVAGQSSEPTPQGAIPDIRQAGQNEAQNSSKNGKNNFDRYNCETCANRKYTDGSNDPGVSYKTPTTIAPEKAASAVRAHEQEHVTRERASAQREGREVVSQSVSYHTAICPECGSSYAAGGTTRTVTKGQVENTYGLNKEEKGQNLDLTA